jgi:penicillin-binding protein 2
MAKKRKEIQEVANQISRRMLFVGGLQISFGLILVGRLYQLQILHNDAYLKLSDKNQFDHRLVMAPRGRILDSKNRLLAGNSEVFELIVIPARAQNLQKLLSNIDMIIGLSQEEINEIIDIAKNQPDFLEISIKSDLTQRELSHLAIRSAILEGVLFQKNFNRIYPQGKLLSHVTGYVSGITANEIEQNRSLRRLVGLKTGKVGLEKTLDESLRGIVGEERIEVNSRGKPVRFISDRTPKQGSDSQLTIDIDVQSYAVDRLKQGNSEQVELSDSAVQEAITKNDALKAYINIGETMILKDSKSRYVPPETGAVVLMDVETGGVVAMVSSPAYDPNLFAGRLSNRAWQNINDHPRVPLLNRVVAGLYSPGSTFKMAVYAAALEAGVISSDTSYICNGFFEFGDRNFYCWQEKGHGKVNGRQAIAQSCDVYFYQIALKTGIDRIQNMANRMGLGIITDVGIPGEKLGIIPNRQWKKNNRGTVWTPGETVIAGIGQGFVLTTPIQLAVMAARIGNGRKAVKAKLLSEHAKNSDEFQSLNISGTVLKEIQRSMRSVVAGGRGTARNYDLKGYGMAGKTGTVQVKRISKAERDEGIIDNTDRRWEERDHALFVAYAPYEKPKYAISVIVEHGGSGSSMAAPIARDILKFTLDRQSL